MKQIKTIYWMLMTLLVLVSCKSEDEVATVLYNDAAITSFTLGTLNRYVSGTKSTLAGSAYAMQINQATQADGRRLIENTDSLPIGTDVAHVVCSVSSLNNGVVGIKFTDSDDFYYYSSADSIDFTSPRIFRVKSSSATGYNDYTVKLNVHKEDGEVYTWKQLSGAVKPTTPSGVKQYLGPSSFTDLKNAAGEYVYEEYGLSTGNKIMAKLHKDATWNQDIPDDHQDIANQPVTDVALIAYPMPLADSTDYVLLAGTVSGSKTAVWRKIVDYSGKIAKGTWTYLDRDGETAGLLPAIKNLRMFFYDGVVFAIGDDYRITYESRDNGITWHYSTRFQWPSDFDYTTTLVEPYVDKDNYITIYCDFSDGTTKAWKGRLNRLGWGK